MSSLRLDKVAQEIAALGLTDILRLDVVRHGTEWAENVNTVHTTVVCVGCDEEIPMWVCQTEEGNPKQRPESHYQKIYRNLALCRDPKSCDCRNFNCTECKG